MTPLPAQRPSRPGLARGCIRAVGALATQVKVILVGVLFGSAAFILIQVLIHLSRAVGSAF